MQRSRDCKTESTVYNVSDHLVNLSMFLTKIISNIPYTLPPFRFHESCSSCYKPLQSGQNSCKSCRQQIGICFLCHESVKGVFVWCPGCGHGGHLQCALEWFGKSQTDKLRKLCPTGCGHQCNLINSSCHA